MCKHLSILHHRLPKVKIHEVALLSNYPPSLFGSLLTFSTLVQLAEGNYSSSGLATI